MASLQEKLVNYATNLPPLRYPLQTIENTTDYFKLELIEYSKAREAINSFVRTKRAVGSTEQSKYSIILPMPSNIQDGNSVSYADDSLNGYVAAAASGITDTFSSLGNAQERKTAIDNIQTEINRVLDDPMTRNIINKSIAAQAVNIFGGNVSAEQLLARETGQIFNPNMELLFNGVTLRSFKFSFKMTPRNEDEALSISAIIRKLKQWMSAKTGSGNVRGGFYLKTPGVFQPYFMKGLDTHPYLNLFKLCALTDISVNYTGENVYATYYDGSPVSYIMDLTFKELEPVYYEDYVDYNSYVGF